MALNECTEWGRVTILTTLAEYPPIDVKESEHICERVAPQFQHVNPSVVLAAIKVVFIHMKMINPDLVRQYLKKMAPPLGERCRPFKVLHVLTTRKLRSFHPRRKYSMSH
jgi:vesicle coat complex subunit